MHPGDQHLVAPFAGGMLVAVLDSVGREPSALAAARTAIDLLDQEPELPVVELVARCHVTLARLGGLVMCLASFDLLTSRMTWIGIGKVEGVLIHPLGGLGIARERLRAWGGTIDQSVGALRPASVPVSRDDVIVFATGGIQANFIDSALLDDVRGRREVVSIADRILAQHAQGRDEAQVLVARYRGSSL